MGYKLAFLLISTILSVFVQVLSKEISLNQEDDLKPKIDVEDLGSFSPVVTIEDGKVRGKINRTILQNKTYYAFQGIPFAKPPIGELRFKPPVKNSKWNDTLNATQDKSECVQGGVNSVQGSEDCLYINVYTPDLTSKHLPVMVWIYGGAFTGGNSSFNVYGPEYLLDEDVIVVQFNYRVGIFGFISTGDLAAPGNVGLRDQILALQWVQSNIKYFGGDAQKVTIFGESAGAASVSYLLQIKAAKGLFRAAIMESGSSLCLWALNRRARRTAFGTGKVLLIFTENSTELIDKLRETDYKKLQEASVVASTYIAVMNPLAGIRYSPVKEPYYEGALFYNNSEELFSRGDFQRIPTLVGFNSNEAATVGNVTDLMHKFLRKYDLNNSLLVATDLTDDNEKILAAADEIKLYFFGNSTVVDNDKSVVKFISNDQFTRPIRQQVLTTSPYAPVYFYEFSYKGVLGEKTDSKFEGVGHGEELGYIFRLSKIEDPPDNDKLTRSRMVKLWTNFAKYLNPTPTPDPLLQNVTWLVANNTPNSLTYLDINTKLEIRSNPFLEDMKFWDELYKKYGTPPYDTY